MFSSNSIDRSCENSEKLANLLVATLKVLQMEFSWLVRTVLDAFINRIDFGQNRIKLLTRWVFFGIQIYEFDKNVQIA